MEIVSFIKIEQARANSFNLFSALFCQPEDEILRNSELFKTLSQLFKMLELNNDVEIRDFEKALDQYSETELLVEYAKLFIGPFKTLVPPYSSIYLGATTVMSKDTMWVLQQYHKMGLDFNLETRDLPDHISIETGFLYYLIFNEIKNLKENNSDLAKNFYEAQKVFLADHFNKWVPKFCGQGIINTNNQFYIILFRLLDQFTRQIKLADFPSTVYPDKLI